MQLIAAVASAGWYSAAQHEICVAGKTQLHVLHDEFSLHALIQ